MKKSVIMLILIVYIASLCIVGFFGSKIIVYDKNVPVEDIVCLTDGVTLTKDNKNSVIRAKAEPSAQYPEGIEYYYETTYQEGLKIPLIFVTKPDNASTGGVYYSMDDNKSYFSYELADNGKTCILAIHKNMLSEITVTIESKDKKVRKHIWVRIKPDR